MMFADGVRMLHMQGVGGRKSASCVRWECCVVSPR